MKTFQQFQQDIREKTGLIRKSFELGKRLVSGGKKFLGKKTVPGTKIKLPLGMSRGEAGLLQIGASGTLGKTIIDRKNKRKELDNIMKFNYQEEIAVAPTNNVGDGKIAGTVEAGDDPPVKKKKKKGKKKRYIYGGRGSRKMWMK